MKMRAKKGFTLAEVLMTLAIIGVVAAITLPTVMNTGSYKSLGVKLSKFVSTTENAARAYVAANDSFRTGDDITGFIQDTFLTDDDDDIALNTDLMLKDGTQINVDNTAGDDLAVEDRFSAAKYGAPSFVITFEPRVTGLPNSTKRDYKYVVTETGYVFPSNNDQCAIAIYDEKFVTPQRAFDNGGALANCIIAQNN